MGTPKYPGILLRNDQLNQHIKASSQIVVLALRHTYTRIANGLAAAAYCDAQILLSS